MKLWYVVLVAAVSGFLGAWLVNSHTSSPTASPNVAPSGPGAELPTPGCPANEPPRSGKVPYHLNAGQESGITYVSPPKSTSICLVLSSSDRWPPSCPLPVPAANGHLPDVYCTTPTPFPTPTSTTIGV